MPSELPDKSIKVSVDRGGTFCDVYASWPRAGGRGKEREEGVLKLLSVDEAHYKDAPREGVRRVLELATGNEYPRDKPLPVDKIDSIRLSTTVATNALLERKGAKFALLVTKGFKDLLRIGNQSRPRIFDLNIKLPGVLYDKVVEVDERVTLVGYAADPKRDERAVKFDDDGKVTKGYDEETYEDGEVVQGMSGEAVRILKRPDEEQVERDLRALYDEGYRSLAVVFMHAFTFANHEQIVERVAKRIGFEYISISSSTLPMIRVVARGASTTADAYLTPVLRKYIDSFFDGFESSLREEAGKKEVSREDAERTTTVEFMRSDGGLTDVRGFSGLRSILSGPAGGVVGYAQTSWKEGGKPVIGLDMGGTSTDVSRFDGSYEQVFETTTAGVTIQSPQLAIETVAAGGGSRLFWRNNLFVTGPESAGSDPGPACYRKGGPPAITDANLVLGRLLPSHFPAIFGPNENESLDVEASTRALADLAKEINSSTGQSMSTDEVAWGFIRVANETMCRPIRALTEARGYDTSNHVLACFGGAGGQHACSIAQTLGIRTILIHRYSSVLSAYGMALAERVVERQEPSSETWASSKAGTDKLEARLTALGDDVKKDLRRQGFDDDRIELEPILNMRYEGTDTALMTKRPDDGDFGKAFAKHYRSEFGFQMSVPVIVDDVRVRGLGKSFDSVGESVWDELNSLQFGECSRTPEDGNEKTKCSEKASVYFDDDKGRQDTPVYLLDRLEPGDAVRGPAMIIDGTQTVVVDPRGTAKITSKHILIELSN